MRAAFLIAVLLGHMPVNDGIEKALVWVVCKKCEKGECWK